MTGRRQALHQVRRMIPEPDTDELAGPATDGLGRTAARGGAIVMSAQAAKFVLGLGAIFILARILDPAALGSALPLTCRDTFGDSVTLELCEDAEHPGGQASGGA